MEGKYHRKSNMTIEDHRIFSAQVHRLVELQSAAHDDLRIPNKKQARIKEMVAALVNGFYPGLEWDLESHTMWAKPQCPLYSEMSERNFRTRVDLLWHLYGLEAQRRLECHRRRIMDTLMCEFGTLYISTEW